MSGVCLNEKRDLELRQFTIPQDEAVPPGYVKLRVMRAGICATDLGYIRRGSPKLRLPVILGHELSGIVTAVGPGVTDFAPGTRVTVTNDAYTCGTCRLCRSGAGNLCLKRRSIGSGAHGGFAEFMVVPVSQVLEVPARISYEEAALLEVLACCVHALERQAKLTAGKTVLVMGPGVMGLCAALTAKALGCRVILAGLKKDGYRLEKALEMGIHRTVDIQSEDLAAVVAEETGGEGVDTAVEAAGSYPAADACARNLARRGTYVQLGLPHGQGRFDLSYLSVKELTMVGSYAKTLPSWYRAMDLVSTGAVDLKPLVPERLYALEEYPEAFAQAERGDVIKVMFDPQK